MGAGRRVAAGVSAAELRGADVLRASIQQELEFLGSPERIACLNVAIGWRLLGPLDDRVAQAAFDAIVRRHEILRTCLAIIDGRVMQVVVPSLATPLEQVDLRAVPRQRRGRRLDRLIADALDRPIPLTRVPQIHGHLVTLGDRDRVLVVVVSHTIWDAASTAIFAREFTGLYAALAHGPSAPLDDLAVQFGDVAEWQRGEGERQALTRLGRELRSLGRELRLPRREPPLQRPFREVLTEPVPTVPRWVMKSLDRLGRSVRATRPMAMLAALAALLSAYTDEERLVLGLLDANRDRPETRPVIGCLAQLLPIGIDVAGDPSFPTLLARVRDEVRRTREQGLTMSATFPAQPAVDDWAASVCRVALNFVAGDPTPPAAGLVPWSMRPYVPQRWLKAHAVSAMWQFGDLDLSMLPIDGSQGMYGRISYDARALDERLVGSLAVDLGRLLRLIAHDPDRSVGALMRRVRDLAGTLPQAAFAPAAPPLGFVPARRLNRSLDSRHAARRAESRA